jgi:hypothetical protein
MLINACLSSGYICPDPMIYEAKTSYQHDVKFYIINV